VDHPKTIATAIRIGNPANWEGALQAKKESRGLIDAVTDEEILKAYQFMAAEEGIFVEPACAAPVAGVLKLAKKGFFKRGTTLVLTMTGHGLKDPERAIKSLKTPKVIPANLTAVLKEIQFLERI